MNKFIKNNKNQKGGMLVYIIVIIFIFSIVMVPILSLVAGQIKLLKTKVIKEEALQVAEAGINYYQWRLAHYPNDYKDGTAEDGPYIHDYKDFDTQDLVGKFSLEITPPLVGSTVVTIKSTGWTNVNPSIKRTITVRYGVPSLAKYSFLSNDVIWIGEDESVSGEMQSNNGIRFDGYGNAPIGSAKSTYTCPSSQGSPCPTTKNGVWGSASQYTKNFWQFPIPAVDFSALTSNLSSMKSISQTAGIYLPPSNAEGYSLVFNSNATINIYKVNTLHDNPVGIDVDRDAHNEGTDYDLRTLQFVKNMPTNGIIYIEDRVWVEGVVKGRATIASSKLPEISDIPTIYIPNNIVYTAKDGSDVLGLISQNDIVVTYAAPNNLEIDAAMISQSGGCQFFYYPGNIKENITIYGSIMTFSQWTWTWVNSFGNTTSGYKNTYSNYDGNLLYAPPPGFPLSTLGYQLLSWKSD